MENKEKNIRHPKKIQNYRKSNLYFTSEIEI